jgi:phosphate transport system substrate-binding protein
MRLLTVFLLLFNFFDCSQKNVKSIDINGSDTLLDAIQRQAENFYHLTHIPINVSGGGSGVGINMLLHHQTDIANSSRELSQKEKKQPKKICAIPVAKDMLIIAVNQKNPVRSVSKELVKAIYIGKITSWKDLGWKDVRISVYGRQSSSGTYQFFQQKVLHKKDFALNIKEIPGDSQVISSLINDENSIAYVTLSMAKSNKDKIKIVNYENENPLDLLKKGQDQKYPLQRYLYQVITEDSTSTSLKDWFKYLFSLDGDNVFKMEGLIPLKQSEKSLSKKIAFECLKEEI